MIYTQKGPLLDRDYQTVLMYTTQQSVKEDKRTIASRFVREIGMHES